MFPCCPCCLCPVTALTLLYWHCCRSVTRDKTVSTMSYRYRPIVADSGEWQWQCEWSEQIPTEKENFAFPSLKQHKSYYRHFIISLSIHFHLELIIKNSTICLNSATSQTWWSSDCLFSIFGQILNNRMIWNGDGGGMFDAQSGLDRSIIKSASH